MSGKKSKTQEVKHRDVNAAQRVIMALDLLNKRLSYDEIASKCGYASRGAAYNAIQRELKRRIHPKIDELRDQELSILDEIHRRVWEVAFPPENDTDENDKEEQEEEGKKKSKDKVNLWAVDRLLELSRDRRKLLNLDVQPEEIAAAQVVIREVPTNYFLLDTPQETQL